MSTVVSDEEAKTNIAANVKRRLSVLRMSQADLSRATGENEMRISSVVRAVHLPTAAFLARIAEALETTVDDLLQARPKKSGMLYLANPRHRP